MDSKQVWAHIDKVAAALQQQLTAHGPQAWQLLLTIKRVESAAWLGGGVLCLIGAYISYRLCRACIHFAKTANHPEYDLASIGILGSFLLGLTAVMGAFAGLSNLLDVWNWVGTFAPQYAIAHEIAVKILH